MTRSTKENYWWICFMDDERDIPSIRYILDHSTLIFETTGMFGICYCCVKCEESVWMQFVDMAGSDIIYGWRALDEEVAMLKRRSNEPDDVYDY